MGITNALELLQKIIELPGNYKEITIAVNGSDKIRQLVFDESDNELNLDDELHQNSIKTLSEVLNKRGGITIRCYEDDIERVTVYGIALIGHGRWTRISTEELIKAYSTDFRTGKPIPLEDGVLYSEF